jgi:integrase
MNHPGPVTALAEPSLADAIRMIETDESLSSSTRTHWLCSIRRIGEWIGRPLQLLPARLTALRNPVGRLNAARLGVSAKTLANHKSNLRAALGHLSKHGVTVARGALLSPSWKALIERVADGWARKRVYSLFRYLSARGLEPGDVDDAVLEAFFAHREQTTFLAVTPAVRRETARAWNACVDTVAGFPRRHLTVEPVRSRVLGPDWKVFPQGFRDEIDAYLDSLATPHRSANGRRRPACTASTIATRRREIVAAARMAVACGIDIGALHSLRELLHPDAAEKVFDAYWARDGERPRNYVIDLAWKFVSIARAAGCLDEVEIEKLDDMRYELDQHRRNGLTEKNLAVVRAALSGSIWARVVTLPDRLMADACRQRSTSPVKAAVLAELAVAIRLLTLAPVRIGNLAAISLNTNLTRPGGHGSPYWLTFPGYDVKNRVELTFPFGADVTAFIDRYISDFRPTLLRGSNSSWLFPGGDGSGAHKCAATLSEQITERVEKELGLRITGHQFRHAAAAILLKKEPGNYELVRRVLGHRNIQTTVNFYIGLETMDASRQFGELIMQLGKAGAVDAA